MALQGSAGIIFTTQPFRDYTFKVMIIHILDWNYVYYYKMTDVDRPCPIICG